MLYDIRLRLDYRYQSQVGGSRHQVRVMPQSIPGQQQVLSSTLSIDPAPEETTVFTDFFGNPVTAFSTRQPHDHLTVAMEARVEIDRLAISDRSLKPVALVEELSNTYTLAPNSPQHFLSDSLYAIKSDKITAYARESATKGSPVYDIAAGLASRIHTDFDYDGTATDVSTTSIEAFSLKRGVCQDFSHIMISGLRGLGIPAGYVSGLLRTDPPAGQPRLEGADAMHAWVRVWCGQDAGWQEFDPTNGIAASNDHITIGYGRDYDDVTPILGIIKTSGTQVSSQAVDVVPVTAP